MDMVFGLHNWPGLPAGSIGVTEGPVMAGTDRFEIEITGHGGHAAMPHQAVDVVLAGSALVQALQSLVSRNTDPLDSAVVSVTRFHAGHADNVLPETAVLGGTVRTFDGELQEALEEGMRRICTGIEATYRVSIDLRYERGYPPTVNAVAPSEIAREVAQHVATDELVHLQLPPSMGAEDFAYMAKVVPACYVWLGNGPGEGGCMLHSPHYDFNDEIIATGIRYWVRLAQTGAGALKRQRAAEAARRDRCDRALLDAVLVLAGAGIDFDLVADFDEQWHGQFHAGADLGRLHDLARGIALDGRLGIDHFAHDAVGHFDRDGLAVVEHHLDRHAVFEIAHGVTHVFAFDLVLVVLGIHEDVHRVGEVGISALLALGHDLVELVVGLVNSLRGGAGEQILEFELDDRRAAAALVVFGLLHDEGIVADHDDVAGAEFLGDFHVGFPAAEFLNPLF
jgi:hypothetical protein